MAYKLKGSLGLLAPSVVSLALALGCAGVPATSQTNKGAPSGTTASTLRAQLEGTGRNLVEAIQGGRPQDFLSLCSNKGVVFGIDQPELPLEQIRKQLNEKNGVYCLLFDTDCLRKQRGFEGHHSFREMILKARERRIEVSVIRDPHVLAGEVRVFLKDGLTKAASQNNPLEFQFVREQGMWKLGAVPY